MAEDAWGPWESQGYGFPAGRGMSEGRGLLMNRAHGAVGRGGTYKCMHRFPHHKTACGGQSEALLYFQVG